MLASPFGWLLRGEVERERLTISFLWLFGLFIIGALGLAMGYLLGSIGYTFTFIGFVIALFAVSLGIIATEEVG